MFDRFLIRENSLENTKEDGQCTGFKFSVRIADYRGCFLSLHNGYYVKCDDVEYPVSIQRFEINGKEPRNFEEIKKAVWEHWDYDDEGVLWIEKDGGLEPGMHKIELQQSILAQYGYMPWDQEWLENPPVPGKGLGAGKNTTVSQFNLELK